MAKSKIIVVWGNDDLLGSSIEYFLSGKEGWKVYCVSKEEELDALIQAAGNEPIDLLILHHGDKKDIADSPFRLLQDYPSMRVISISLENNVMEVYSKQKILVQQASDLIMAIENATSSSDAPTNLAR